MKTLIIYVSVHHGNTAKVAEVIGNILNADLVQVRQVDVSILEQYDLIGFGSGIYFGKHHKTLLNFVDTLPTLSNKKAFIFSTSGLRRTRLIHNFSKALNQKLQQKGGHVIGEFSCRGFDTSWAAMIVGGINRGRPNAGDLNKAENFATALRDRIRSV